MQLEVKSPRVTHTHRQSCYPSTVRCCALCVKCVCARRATGRCNQPDRKLIQRVITRHVVKGHRESLMVIIHSCSFLFLITRRISAVCENASTSPAP